MFSSHEVRWFLEGSIERHPDLKKWVEHGASNPRWAGRLGGKPDVYVVIPGAADMGIKWREGQLQVKGLESALGTQVFSGGHIGKVERWTKWSYSGKTIEDAFNPWFAHGSSGPRIVEVFKTRCLRKLRINPFTSEQVEVEADALIERGGALEVTNLLVENQEWCSVAFEAFPNDPAMHEDFTRLVNEFVKSLHDVRLQESNSKSYPDWLQNLI